MHNFGALPDRYTEFIKSQIAVLPVPFDLTSTWIRGTDRGPAAMMEASEHLELFDRETRSEVYRCGIFTDEPVKAADSESMIEAVYQRVRYLINKHKFVVTVGGEHTVSVGSVKAHSEAYPGLCVLQLDAHSDMRDSYQGDLLSHACTMARIREIVPRITAVGVRSMDSSELSAVESVHTFPARLINRKGNWQNGVIRSLGRDVYITIDLDVFDPAFMPSTGTPEPGGLDWYAVTGLLKKVSKKKTIRGFDVVELCPSSNKAPDFLAAKLVYKLLSYVFRKEDS